MKKNLTLSVLSIFLMSNSMANGGGLTADQNNRSRGTAGVDEEYLDELKTKSSALERKEQKTREAMKENPRNPAMVESFGQIHAKEYQQKEEEKKIDEDKDRAD